MSRTKTPSYVSEYQKSMSTKAAAGTLIGTAAIGGTFGYLSGRNMEEAFYIQARIAEINAEMERESAERDIRYYSEQAAQEGYAKIDERNSILSSQNLAMAASGFVSQSAGDKRLFTDTYAKYADAERLANRALYLKSFERMKKANIAAEELRSQAAQYRIQGKYMPLSNTLSGIAQGVNTGVQAISIANTFYRNTNNMNKMSETSVNGPLTEAVNNYRDNYYHTEFQKALYGDIVVPKFN